MNSISLTGRTTRDIELRYTPSGKAVANGNIAVQRKFKNANGDYEADFIDFVAWGKTGELMAEYVKKDDHFGISGNLQTRTYEKDGQKRKVTEVNVQDFDFPVKKKDKPSTPVAPNHDMGNPFENGNDPFSGDGKPIDINDDDLPF